MADRSWMEPIVERVVTEVLENHAGQLRSEIVRRVMEEVAQTPVEAPAANNTTAELARAVSEIQLGASQKEILKALLDQGARYASRVALFVVKGGHATGWQGRGFSDHEAIKDFALDSNAPAVARAIGERVIASAPPGDMDSRFVQDFGAPAQGEGRFLPLVLKDKVAAVIYADSGTEAAGQMDAGALELLVLSTSAWLEVSTLRKQAHKEQGERPESRPTPMGEAAPPFNDPFAAHSPGHAMAAAAAATATAEAPAPAPVMSGAVETEPEPVVVVEELSVPAPPMEAETAPVGDTLSLSPEDQETHRKAQRFARLLVDEVKLYNQAKVVEGRKHKDLYDRLKDTIEKSRSTYQKRYGNTVAASGDYFQSEVVRSLAEDDVSIMGANFRQ